MAMFADDTKCYRPVRELPDCEDLQNDFIDLENWCSTWKMDLNQSKCGVMTSGRPVTAEYKLLNIPLKTLSHQKISELLSQKISNGRNSLKK